MDNSNLALKSDQYVQGNVILQNKIALHLPAHAVVRTPQGLVVYKMVKSEVLENKQTSADFKRVLVKTGSQQNGQIAITSGIDENDEVVIEGAWLLDAALSNSKTSSNVSPSEK